MKQRWVVAAKRADFNSIGQHFGIDPVIARIMRNRGMTQISEMEEYLYGGKDSLCDPHLLKDADKAADILAEKIRAGKRICVIGDYDIDGVSATYILITALRELGADVIYMIPDRISDGYGLNDNLVRRARDEGADTILTCDNGIAAAPQVALAKSLGMTVIITDHHEVPYEEVPAAGAAAAVFRREIPTGADATVNPKQSDCPYPYKGICGATVAWKLMQVLGERMHGPKSDMDKFIENAAFATVGDVMDLTGENRVIVKLGLEMLQHTKNIGMRALILQSGLKEGQIKAYHIGFRLGPCINASGRLYKADLSLQLLLCRDPLEASAIAGELIELNENRKLLTSAAVGQAQKIIEEKGYAKDKVIVVFLPDCHESIAGIVAGRIREAYYRPAFVVTRGEETAKGSARSIEGYSMYDEMCKCRELFTKFGGHPMAAGFSLKEENIDLLRERLNELADIDEEKLVPKITIDVPMPVDYVYEELVGELDLLEPFGKGNEKPVFADKNLKIVSLKIVGKDGWVVKMRLAGASGREYDAVYFGDPSDLEECIAEKYGEQAARDVMAGRGFHNIYMNFLYYPQIDHYYGTPRLQLRINGFS